MSTDVQIGNLMTTFNSHFAIRTSESELFARLSGDYNPLHIDAAAARRTRFGGTVVHGIHLYLRTLEALAAQQLLTHAPAAVSASFANPVATEAVVSIHASLEGEQIRLTAHTEGLSAFTAVVEPGAAIVAGVPVEDDGFPPRSPQTLEFPPSVGEGIVPLKLERATLQTLFPALAKLPDCSWIADLLATTHIVGMRCPGLHSIYSGFKLRREPRAESARPRRMHYHVHAMEDRLQLLRLQVAGSWLNGTVEAFFRPPPVLQRSMAEVAAVVSATEFAGHRVLVVGGSRGLGELSAKILAAGGAEVTITYARGQDDADRVCSEIRALDGKCSVQQMQITATQAPEAMAWLASARFSHVHFFATPVIARNSHRWNEALFTQYTQIYVTGFSRLVEQTLAARADSDQPVHFLYPSSIFVTHPEPGFVEYAAAKAAGEAFCDQRHGHRGAQFMKPRLPRVRTDQTSALAEHATADALPIMLDVIRQFHS